MPAPPNPSLRPDAFASLAAAALDRLAASGFQRTGVYVPRGDVLRCAMQRGHSHLHDGIPAGFGPIGRSFLTGMPSVGQGPSTEPGPQGVSGVAGATACLPLRLRGQVVAVLVVQQPQPFSSAALVDVMGVVHEIEQALQDPPAAPQTSPWETLSRETVALTTLQDRGEITALAAARAPGLVGLGSSLIRRVETDRVRVAVAGPDAALLEQLSPESLNRIADWTGGLVSVYAQGQAEDVDNAGLAELGLRSWAVTPLRGGHPADILLVADSSASPVTPQGVEVLELYASHVTSAIRLAELFEQLRFTARRDSVTGLAHSAAFHEALVAACQDPEAHLALLMVDVDNLKQVNERDGYDVGDDLLRHLARRIDAALRERQQLFRVGGDEFGVIVRGSSTAAALTVAERVHAAARTERTSVSVGVSMRSPAQLRRRPDPRLMVTEADMAVQAAKRQGRNRIEVYSAAMGAAILERNRMAAELALAMDRGQLRMVYQPLVDVASHRVSGAEALMRWVTPDRGAVSPGVFIPVAEETGDIVPMGTWALQEAVRQAVEWDLDARDMRLNVNVSGLQLREGFVEEVAQLLAAANLPPHRLTLEITESSLVDDEQRIGLINGLHNLGIIVAIDDFGTGYSSLSYLRRLPIDVLKIDRSFVGELHDARNVAVARTIIELTKVLQLDCVAEGIETTEQLTLLSELGCRVVQGFHLARPLEAVDFMAFADEFATGAWSSASP